MPSMKTTAHYVATGPGVSRKSEALMREPAFVAARLAELNHAAKAAASAAGESTDFEITGTIHEVAHEG
jgi:hypothetical protein